MTLRLVLGQKASVENEPHWAVQRHDERITLWLAGVARVRLGADNARRLAAALLVASEELS